MLDLEQLNYTFEQSAELLCVSKSLLRKLASTGRLRVVRIGRCVRIPRDELLRLSGRQASDSAARSFQ